MSNTPVSKTAVLELIREHAEKLVAGYDQNAAEWFASLTADSYLGVLKAFTRSIDHIEEGTPEWKASIRLVVLLSSKISLFARRIGFENVRYWKRPFNEHERSQALKEMRLAAADILQKLPE